MNLAPRKNFSMALQNHIDLSIPAYSCFFFNRLSERYFTFIFLHFSFNFPPKIKNTSMRDCFLFGVASCNAAHKLELWSVDFFFFWDYYGQTATATFLSRCPGEMLRKRKYKPEIIIINSLFLVAKQVAIVLSPLLFIVSVNFISYYSVLYKHRVFGFFFLAFIIVNSLTRFYYNAVVIFLTTGFFFVEFFTRIIALILRIS